MNDLDQMLDRLAQAPTGAALAAIEGDVLTALADRRSRRTQVRTLCSVAIVGLLIGTGGAFWTPGAPSHSMALAQPPALAPSALLALDGR